MDLSTLHQTVNRDELPLEFSRLSHLLTDLFVVIPPQSSLFSIIAQTPMALAQLKAAIDPESLLLGINPRLDDVQRQTIQSYAQQEHLAVIASEPVEYLDPEDLFASHVLQAIGTGATLPDPTVERQRLGEDYLRTSDQMVQRYAAVGLEQAVIKTSELAQQCNVTFDFKAPVLPRFQTPQGQTSQEYLQALCIAGLKKRQVAPGKSLIDYQQRLVKELKVIHEMGFDDYFLIVWDVMNYAHQHQITTDPGRGSAAGSLVAYALAITEVDPLQYDLLFERFLNRKRAQMPDIDLDIPDNHRDEILQYVHQKYGHQQVAQIITFGTLAAKQVVRNVCRVFSLARYEMESLVAALPTGLSLTDAVQQSQRLRNLLSDHPKERLLIQVAQKLEGLPRHYSIHAAGIVLSQEPLHQLVPLQTGSEGLLMTQFPKDTVEALGLLKMDFLGLKNLSIMDRTMKIIRQQGETVDLANISLDDPLTMRLFQQGQTDGVFQFESQGIRNVLIQLHPTSFEDIVAVNALYRPGPLENIPHFIARKHGQEAITFPDQSLAPILAPTYGILVYQEQVMQLASVMAGFSLGEADLLRRAMSKKKEQTMLAMRTKFIAGAQQRGYSAQVAEQTFDYIDRFANYGFNRSHAVAYSKMAFEMAYLKSHYPAAFFTALMTAETSIDKLKQYVQDAQKIGVKIVGPRINVSEQDFVLQKDQLYFGFGAIKGLRRDFISAILTERQEHGLYQNLPDFINRLPQKWQKEANILPLIYSGAFDKLGYNRAEMVKALPSLLAGVEFAPLLKIENNPALQTTIAPQREFSLVTRLTKENEYLGVYLSGHPVNQYQNLKQQLHTTEIAALQPGQTVTLVVLTNRIKTVHTKKDHRLMAFINSSDASGTIDLTVFPKQFQRYQDLLEENQVIVVYGQVEERSGRGTQVIVNQIQDAKQLNQRLQPKQRWVLRIQQSAMKTVQQPLHRLLSARVNHGDTPVLLYYPATDQKVMLPNTKWLKTNSQVRRQLIELFGDENVVLQDLRP